jgi:large subunit ribosomal protein L5e
MGFIKTVKNKPYFKRYQVKYRRRREGKTDYYARKRLITQDKNKYNSPKYRLVVRFTNTDIICQITHATLDGDIILAAAYGRELEHYGVKVGFKNYAAAYATGLLVARRALAKLNLAEKYIGLEEANGEMFEVVPEEDGPSPFYVLLDVGLARTTTGSRLFAALKGAVDGGLSITHDNKRFIGFDKESKEFHPEKLRKHILGGHVAEYMTMIQDKKDPDDFQFKEYFEKKIKPEDIEEMYINAHKLIRENPSREKKPRRTEGHYEQKYLPRRKNTKQRRNRVKQKLQNLEKESTQQQEQQ